MPILFEVLEAEAEYAEVLGALTLKGVALGFAIDAEDAIVLGSFTLAGAGFAEDEDVFFEPIVPAQMTGTLDLSGASVAYSIDYEEVYGGFTLAGVALSMAADEAMMPSSGLTLDGIAAAGAGPETSYSLLIEQAGIIYGVPASMITTGVHDTAEFTTEPTGTLDYVIHSVAQFTDLPTVLAQFLVTIQDSLVLRDSLALLINAGIESTLNLEDPLEADLRIIAMLADTLDMSDAPEGSLSALATVVSALVLADAFIPVMDGLVESDAVFAEALEARINALVDLASELALADEATLSLHMLAVIEDELQLSDEPGALLAMLAELLDTVSFMIRADTGQTQFAGYTVNLRNAAVSEYTNYNYNSFATIGGRAYGASENGVFRLDGDTDNGDPIQALVRTGVIDMDGLVHVPKAWIGLTSSGDMVLKAITMDKGRRQENWYRMTARPQGTPVESRFNPAKGLTSTYWQWELENVDGAYFELDIVKLWPVAIGRRYSGR